MMTNPETIETLTRAEIARRKAPLIAKERELTARAAASFAQGGPAPAAPSPRDAEVRERTRALLNGAGDLLMPPRAGAEEAEADILVERDAVRAALAILARADVEAEAVETAKWGVAHSAEWTKLLDTWTGAYLAFLAAEQAARTFRDTAGPNREATLAKHVAGRVAIDLPPTQFAPFLGLIPPTVEEVLDMSRAAGVRIRRP